MQFKKHFSSNLQNLAIKKTYVLNQPLHLQSNQEEKVPSQGYQSLGYFHPYHANKQNIKFIDNQNSNTFKTEYMSSKRIQIESSAYKNSPQLTFNKLKNMNKENMRDVFEKKSIVSSNCPPFGHMRTISCHSSKDTKNKMNHQLESNRKNHFNQNSQRKTHVRYGSMLFGSSSKNIESQQNCHRQMRQSRSIDQVGIKQTSFQLNGMQCVSNDGRNAKYKLIQEDYSEEDLYYCFDCAIKLVKQGFSIHQINNEDKLSSNLRSSAYNSQHQKTYSYHEQDRQSFQTKTNQLSNNIKVGEQLKCKIIMKLNKLKVGKEQFNKNIENHLENIDYFYNSLIAHIEQQKINDKNQILRIKNLRKNEPENYENKLSSFLGTIDYMMRTLQHVNRQVTSQIEQMLYTQISYPKIKMNIQPRQGFQGRIDEFTQFFNKNLKISLVQNPQKLINRSRSQYSNFSEEENSSCSRLSSLRFSFEQALQKSRRAKKLNDNQSCASNLLMDTLEQQNESQLEQSLQYESKRHNAFRNLFPDDNQESFEQTLYENYKKSPVFKQF